MPHFGAGLYGITILPTEIAFATQELDINPYYLTEDMRLGGAATIMATLGAATVAAAALAF